jgi:hypothetical protein
MPLWRPTVRDLRHLDPDALLRQLRQLVLLARRLEGAVADAGVLSPAKARRLSRHVADLSGQLLALLDLVAGRRKRGTA